MGVPILALFSAVGSLISEPIKTWQQKKRAELNSDLRVTEAVTNAKIKRLEIGQEADISWENLSIQNSGWKDEFLLLVFSVPLVMCFVPGCVGYVEAGFIALQETPAWYQTAISVMVASSFGVKKYIDFKKVQKGK